MAINKTTTETKNKIKANSVIALPNRPQIPAEQLKQAFVKPIVDTSNSMIQELDRIVEETNAELEGIDDTLQNHENRIGELEQFAEEIEGALENKADLVDGKVPREQLPSFEEIPSTEIGNHNTSETSHTDIRNAVAEAKAIAEGKSRARVFATKSALDTWLLDDENKASLRIGDNFYIEETDKPDYWWNGTTIKELETQKVDLTEYAKKTDIPDITVNNGDAESGKYISQIAVDATNKHKLNITKADLPQGFSGNYDDLTNKPTIPTIPDITVNNGSAESGKYISKIEVDATDKHKLVITKADLPSIPTNTVSSTTITTIVKLTQAEYDLLTPNTNTLYIIVG